MIRLILIGLVAVLVMAGCSVDEPVNPTEWKEGPFTKVRLWDRFGRTTPQADVWFESELGDKIRADYARRYDAITGRPYVVYVIRKDGTRWSLPKEVHDPEGGTFRINTYHLTFQGREVNFFQP
jgi:hypothetical protein